MNVSRSFGVLFVLAVDCSLPVRLQHFFFMIFNPLAYTDVCEMAGLARSINTQPAVRRNSETNPTSQYNRGMY